MKKILTIITLIALISPFSYLYATEGKSARELRHDRNMARIERGSHFGGYEHCRITVSGEIDPLEAAAVIAAAKNRLGISQNDDSVTFTILQ